jgi:guanylate kinase
MENGKLVIFSAPSGAGKTTFFLSLNFLYLQLHVRFAVTKHMAATTISYRLKNLTSVLHPVNL